MCLKVQHAFNKILFMLCFKIYAIGIHNLPCGEGGRQNDRMLKNKSDLIFMFLIHHTAKHMQQNCRFCEHLNPLTIFQISKIVMFVSLYFLMHEKLKCINIVLKIQDLCKLISQQDFLQYLVLETILQIEEQYKFEYQAYCKEDCSRLNEISHS